MHFKSLQYPTRNPFKKGKKGHPAHNISKTRQYESILTYDDTFFKQTFITFEQQRKPHK